MQNNSVGARSAAQRHASRALRERAVFGGAPVSRQWASAAASRRRERPATSAALPRRADLGCPYEVLGLPPGTSDEAAVKRAYRKLAKKYHPDVLLNSSSQHAAQPQSPQPPSIAPHEEPHAEHAPVQFLSIAEAYSFIMERLRNGVAADGVSPRPGNSRAFHEWMWEFRMRRTWQRQQRHAATPPDFDHGSDAEVEEPVAEDACGCSDSPAGGMGMNGGAASAGAHHAVPQSAEGLRSQLAGLRHRAAIRKNRPPTPSPSGASSDADEPQAPTPTHPAFARGDGTWFAAATGPSDSADPAPAAAAAASHVVSAQAEVGAEQPLEPAATQPEQGGVEGHEAAAAAGGARRRFASNSTVREALREQLSGMRRKAALRERIYSGAEPGADGMAA